MDEQAGHPAGSGEDAVRDALARFLPVFTREMPKEEADRAGSAYRDLFTISFSDLDPAAFGAYVADRIRNADGAPLATRRRMLAEDALTAEVGKLDRGLRETAAGIARGEITATAGVKRETRRAAARLGQLNAVLVGRFPHLTPMLEMVSESYLDAMFILGDGKGIPSTRLRKLQEKTAPPKEQP